MMLIALLALCVPVGFASCSDSDDDDAKADLVVAETEVNMGAEDTSYSVNLTSRASWKAVVEEEGTSWLTLTTASGMGGNNQVAFTTTKNDTHNARQATIRVTSLNESAEIKVTQAGSDVITLKESDIPNFDKYYKPKEFSDMNMLRSDAKWSWVRSKQSEHFFVFWEAGFGDNPNAETVPEGLRVDIDDLLAKAEKFYDTNVNKLQMVEVGKGTSQLDKYKMEIYLLYQTEWLATGSGYDNVIGALWVNPSTCQPVGSTIAHEIGHSFQYQTYCDNILKGKPDDLHSGWRYGYEGSNGGCGFWEQCAQWQSFQDYPNEPLDNYYTTEWFNNCHRHFENEWQRYASYWLQYYWTAKHGITTVGKLWNNSQYPEDAIQAYTRLFCNGSYETVRKELFDYAQRMATFDINVDGVKNYYTDQDKNYNTKFYSVDDGYYQVAYAKCPGATGFNVIHLDVPSAGTKVTVDIEALKAGSALAPDDPGTTRDGDGKAKGKVSIYNNVGNDQAVAYGFVALKKDGTRVYGDMNVTSSKGQASFTVPENTSKLYLIVQGSPESYHQSAWDEDETTDFQCPYKLKVSGTNLTGYFSVDTKAEPKDLTLTYDLKCDASLADYQQGTINLQDNGDIRKICQALAMEPSTLSGKTEPISNGTTAKPAEGNICFGLQSASGMAYSYTSNAGFYCKADGSVGSWSDNDPLWVEYDKDNFILTYGHKPGASVAGTKYTIKPTLAYTKDGKEYKVTFVLNLQF